MNIFRMLSAILRGLAPHPADATIRARQSAYAREATMQWGREYDWDGCTVTKEQLRDTREEWKRK